MSGKKAKLLRGRKDHWLPQGYLRGFVAPSRISEQKPLFCFQKHSHRWKEVSPREIAHGIGFYDYATGTDVSPSLHSDSVFARLEREFPLRRELMVKERFENWQNHKDFLLEFMQMMRARSPLAMQEQEAEVRKIRASIITAVDHEANSVTVDSLEPRPLSEDRVRNMTISRVLDDVRKGSSWMQRLVWCLRYTDDEETSFCTADQALAITGTLPADRVSMELMSHPDTIVMFPISWQACLFGYVITNEDAYDKAQSTHIANFRRDYLKWSKRFVIAAKMF